MKSWILCALVGVALGTLVTSVILVAASQVPGGQSVQKAYSRTSVGQFIFYAAPVFYEQVRNLSGGQVEEVWDRVLDEARKSGTKVKEEVEKAAHEAKSE